MNTNDMQQPPGTAGARERELANAATEAIRGITHLTLGSPPIPAPEMFEVLGDLKCLGYGLDQALRQLARSLASSLAVYAVFEEDGGNPEESVAYAMDSMRVAAGHESRLGEVLDFAQADITRQGYYPPTSNVEAS
jgi:hypothetical protein